MKKTSWTLIFLLLLTTSITSVAKSSDPIFSATGIVKGQMLEGNGTIIDENKFLEMTSTDNYQVKSGNKAFNINSIYATTGTYGDGTIGYQINYYTTFDANSGSDIFVINGKMGETKVSINGVKGSQFEVYKKPKKISEIATSGKAEMLPTSEGEGVHYIYKTDWDEEFNILEKKLVKISTTYGDGVTNTVNIFTYKKDGFKDYDKCLKDKNRPFCFKKDNNQLVLAAKAQLGNDVSFWISGKQKIKASDCPKNTEKFVEKNKEYQFCYPKEGKVEMTNNEVQFSSPNDKNQGLLMGWISMQEFDGTVKDYLATLQSDGVMENIEEFKNKVGLTGTSYDFGGGGASEKSIIFQKPSNKKLYILHYGFADNEDTKFLKVIGDYFLLGK